VTSVAQTKTARVSPTVAIASEQAKAFYLGTVSAGSGDFDTAPAVGNLIVVGFRIRDTTDIPTVTPTLGGVSSFTLLKRGRKTSGYFTIEGQIFVGIKTSSSSDVSVAFTSDRTKHTQLAIAELSITGGDFSVTPSGSGFAAQQSQGVLFYNGGVMNPGDDLRVVSLNLGCPDNATTVTTPVDNAGQLSDWIELVYSGQEGQGRGIGLWAHVGGRYMDTGNNGTANVLGIEGCRSSYTGGLYGLTIAHTLRVNNIPNTTVDVVLDSAPALSSLIVVAVDITKSIHPATPIASMTMGGVSSFTMVSAEVANEDAVGQVQLWYGIKTGASVDDTVAIVCDAPYDQVTAVVTEFNLEGKLVTGLDGAVGTAGSSSWTQPHWAEGAALVPTNDSVLCLMTAVACHARPEGEVGGTRPSDTFEDPPWVESTGVTPSDWEKAGQESGYWAGKGNSGTNRRSRCLGLWWVDSGFGQSERCYIFWGNGTASLQGDVKSVGIPVMLITSMATAVTTDLDVIVAGSVRSDLDLMVTAEFLRHAGLDVHIVLRGIVESYLDMAVAGSVRSDLGVMVAITDERQTDLDVVVVTNPDFPQRVASKLDVAVLVEPPALLPGVDVANYFSRFPVYLLPGFPQQVECRLDVLVG